MSTPEYRVEAINDTKKGEVLRLLGKALPAALNSHATRERKFIRVLEISEKVMDIVGRYTPCKRGCSACCHMAVTVSHMEAKKIAEVTGREMKIPKWTEPDAETEALALKDTWAAAEMHLRKTAIAKYTGVPCPFLKDRECSIYSVRPLACRNHHVVENDASKCYVGEVQQAGSYDLSAFDNAVVELWLDEPFGDIREFFP